MKAFFKDMSAIVVAMVGLGGWIITLSDLLNDKGSLGDLAAGLIGTACIYVAVSCLGEQL